MLLGVRLFMEDIGIWLKTRVRFYWWVIKYGGRKNIPPEVVFGAMAESMERMKENMMNAWRSMPKDVDDEDREQFFEAFAKMQEMERGMEEMRKGK